MNFVAFSENIGSNHNGYELFNLISATSRIFDSLPRIEILCCFSYLLTGRSQTIFQIMCDSQKVQTLQEEGVDSPKMSTFCQCL